MRRSLSVALFAALLAPFVAASVGEAPFTLHALHPLAPATRECLLIIAPGVGAADVLTEASVEGCITSWSYSSPGDDVDRIEDLCGGWALHRNGTRLPGFFADHTFDPGDHISFVLLAVAGRGRV